MTDGDQSANDDAQEGDMAEIAQAAQEAPDRMRETRNRMVVGSDERRHPMSMGAQVGGSRAETSGPTDEVRQRRGVGRRVTLARQRTGSYSIWMRDHLVQSFCGEWEDITRFQLPEGIEQQVRINIEVMGEARMLRPEYSERGSDVAHPDDGVELRSIAHPNNPPIVRDDLLSMFNSLPAHNQEIIARQIRENYAEMPDVDATEVTIEMFNEMQCQIAELSGIVHRLSTR